MGQRHFGIGFMPLIVMVRLLEVLASTWQGWRGLRGTLGVTIGSPTEELFVASRSLTSVAQKVNFGSGLRALSRLTGDTGVGASFLMGEDFSGKVLNSLSVQ